MKIQGFWDRVDEVCAEDGRQKHEIVKAMGGGEQEDLIRRRAAQSHVKRLPSCQILCSDRSVCRLSFRT